MKCILIILFFLSLSSASLATTCEIRSSASVYTGPARNQGTTAYCYGFTATALLQERYCRNKVPACDYSPSSKDLLSVLDVIALGNYGDGGLKAGGFTDEVLINVKHQGEVFPEGCAPFETILKHDQIAKGQLNPKWRIKIMKAVNFINSSCPDQKKKDMALGLKAQLQLATGVDQILNAASKEASIRLKEILIPKECEQKGNPLPAFEIGKAKINKKTDYEEELDKHLNAKIPVGISLCAHPKTSTTCSPHSLTVAGVREVCCNGICKKEYKIIDSSNAFKDSEYSKLNSEKGWLSENLLWERVEMIHQLDPQNVDMVWLD